MCSRSAGHAIDVEGQFHFLLVLEAKHIRQILSDGCLVLRHRRPVSLPFPNAYAHPLPRFSYNQKSGEITVAFSCDPSYPPPGTPPSNSWKGKTYLLTAIPMRKPRTILDNASEFIASSILTPISFLTGTPAPPPARPDEVFNGDIDLNEDEVLEEEKGEEAEVDNSPEQGRKVRVIAVPTDEKDMLDLLLTEKARNRRRWVVTPLRTTYARTK